jgi:formate dehydrogenase major subunit
MLHAAAFVNQRRATLQCIEYRPTSERTTTQYPLLLITGRSLYQFNAGTMTGRTPNTELRPEDVLDVAPADAVALGVDTGDPVRVTSRYGQVVLPARISADLDPGHLFATFQTNGTFLNRVTGSNRDGAVGTPEYKLTAVCVERVADEPDNDRGSP